MARKGRRRRFQEARALKRSFDDGLFAEGDRTLADIGPDDSWQSVDRDLGPVPLVEAGADTGRGEEPPDVCIANKSGSSGA